MAGFTRPYLPRETPRLVLLSELDGMEARIAWTDNLTWFGERFIERVGRGVEKTHAEKLRQLLDYI
jgi:hypothetical protein